MSYEHLRQMLSTFIFLGAGNYSAGLRSESRAVRRAALRVKAKAVVAQARYLDGRLPL